MSHRDPASLTEHFGSLVDPRVDRTKRHNLLDIVTIALCGVIAGADSWVDVEAFGRRKAEWLCEMLDLPNGIPSHGHLWQGLRQAGCSAVRALLHRVGVGCARGSAR